MLLSDHLMEKLTPGTKTFRKIARNEQRGLELLGKKANALHAPAKQQKGEKLRAAALEQLQLLRGKIQATARIPSSPSRITITITPGDPS